MKRLKTVSSIIAVLLVGVLAFGFLNRLLSLKYMGKGQEGGRMLGEYYKEAGDHDVIFLGDCDVYANFSPMELWRSQGITAYVRGSSQQFIWQSYYILEETLTYETPKAVVFNVNALQYGKDYYADPVRAEEQNRMTMDQLRLSPAKLAMIQASMTAEESVWDYIFPILRYHDRFDKLTAEDWQYIFETPDATFSGYLPNHGVKPMTAPPLAVPVGSSYDFPAECYEYLDKMAALCDKNGIELILVRSPRQMNPVWHGVMENRVKAYAEKHHLAYYNFGSIDFGLDLSTDSYDGGEHLNHAGAVKLSRYFAGVLVEDHGIRDRRGQSDVANVFNKKLKIYDEAIEQGKEDAS